MRLSSSLSLLILSLALSSGCKQHPLLGTWAFGSLEQAWEVENHGKLTVSFGYADEVCTEGGQGSTVHACHQQRKWAKTDTVTLNESGSETFQFVVFKMSAHTLNGRLETCACRQDPEIYFGTLEEGDLLLYDSPDENRTLVDRGKFQGSDD